MAGVKYGNSAFEKLIVRKQKAIRKELRDEATAVGREMKDWLTVAVREWSSKPRFAATVTIKPDDIEIKIKVAGTMKMIFHYVDQGTGLYGPKKQPYVIEPKTPGGVLKFQSGYSARSAPGAKIGMGSGQSFGDWVSKRSVIHPGIQPRNFTDKVVEELNPDFVTRMADAIGRGVNE